MRKLLSCGAVLLLLASPFVARAEEEVIPPSPIVKTELMIDAAEIKAGQPFWAGVHFTMPENWHIYWQNPGDAGIPTTLSWTLPEGITAGPIHWPTPTRVTMMEIANYAYSNTVILPVPLTPAKDGITGDVTVKASWLVCHNTCIPESATFTVALPHAQGESALKATIAELPKPSSVAAHYMVEGESVILSIDSALYPDLRAITQASWFPMEDGVIRNDASPVLSIKDDVQPPQIILTAPRASGELPDAWSGELVLDTATGPMDVIITATRDGAAPTPVAEAPPPPPAPSYLLVLGLAFLGGLLLNIMPCVLPILALKALAIAKKAQAAKRVAVRQGIAYTVGVVVSFLIIAGIMLALKASGAAIGWGFQLQNSGFVAVLTFIMLLVAANLLGLFHLPVLFGTHAHEVNEDSRFGSFLTGALAVLVATPCTAPFMATALGATLALPTLAALLVFAALGLGMASPFLIISLWPAALRLIPKPGAWMNRFKQFLALPVLATAAWLIWVLVQLHGTPTPMASAHEPYSAARLQELRNAGTPVFVDATAAWCLTCKVNERIALENPATQQLFREKNITFMVADWTANDPEITSYLASFGRNGVPLYVYYPPHAEPVVLPQLLSPSLVQGIIN